MSINKKINRVAHIYFHDVLAGTLAETEQGVEFCYDRHYLDNGRSIAYLLPLQAEPFVFNQFPAIFGNLLSEGWMRKLQSAEQHIDENDQFTLLVNNGADLIGAISVELKHN